MSVSRSFHIIRTPVWKVLRGEGKLGLQLMARRGNVGTSRTVREGRRERENERKRQISFRKKKPHSKFRDNIILLSMFTIRMELGDI
jgi:hypothetical protein